MIGQPDDRIEPSDVQRPHIRPVRSLLFIPGNRASWMPKAVAAGADATVFDLEGSTPYDEKAAARRDVRSVIDSADSAGPAVFVRINDSHANRDLLLADIDTVVGPGLAGVLLPQVEGVDEVVRLADALGELEAARGMPVGGVAIMPLMETPQALYAAYQIATSTPRIAYMGAGISRRGDIARTMGYRWTREGFETLYFRSKVLLEMRAAQVENPLSGMWGVVDDLDGLRYLADQTRDIGYEGMMVIHPSHVAIVNEIFSPTPEELQHWRDILAAMADGLADGRGAIRLHGEVVDEAHVKTAELGLARAARWDL